MVGMYQPMGLRNGMENLVLLGAGADVHSIIPPVASDGVPPAVAFSQDGVFLPDTWPVERRSLREPSGGVASNVLS